MSLVQILFYLPFALFKSIVPDQGQKEAGLCDFYEGYVFHLRKSPVKNSFR